MYAGIVLLVRLLFVFQYMTAAAAAAPMQGTYIPQYTPVPPTAVPVEVRLHSVHIKNLSMFTQMEDIITPDSPLPYSHKHSLCHF